jgi:hypothetical protein
MAYPSGIVAMAKVVGSGQNPDLALSALLHLAAAWSAIKQLESKGVPLEISGRPIVLSAIERAFMEASMLRSTVVPNNLLDVSCVTKFGRVVDESKISY